MQGPRKGDCASLRKLCCAAESPLQLGLPLLVQPGVSAPAALATRGVVATCQWDCGRRCFVLQVDLESILQSPGGKAEHFTEAAALQAFSLHCRLSIHLQHRVRPSPPPSRCHTCSLTKSPFCCCWTVLLRRKSVPVCFGRHWILVGKQSFIFYPRSRGRGSEAS